MSELPEDQRFMQAALELARDGQGSVEPNPMVGCVIVRSGTLIGRGWHQQFGDRHAEINAIADAKDSVGSTVYVTLEPCCHHGKTPPCTDALVKAKVGRVVVATTDPFEKVAGNGIKLLKEAGIDVTVGVLEREAQQLIAPYTKLIRDGIPWVIAKWAMTLDGKIATRTGDSKWISNPDCREIVHEIRGRVDAVMIGRGTAVADDPGLDARPQGPRVATRIVLDSSAQISLESQLVQTAHKIPVIVVCKPEADSTKVSQLQKAGCEVLQLGDQSTTREKRLELLLRELGDRKMTNILVEGGSELLGSLFDLGQVNEAHIFIGNKIAGGNQKTAVAGVGIEKMVDALSLKEIKTKSIADNIYVQGYL